ncbi:MAG: hypothetical protein ACPGJV_09010 [Bacteriovoracaceae bacterium]
MRVLRKAWAQVLLISVLSSPAVYAESAADALLKNVGAETTEANAPKIETEENNFNLNFKLDDPFLVQFFQVWKNSKLEFEINRWSKLVMSKNFEKASHLLSVAEQKAPHEFKGAVLAAKLYLYYRLGLSQTFVETWLQNKNSPYLKGKEINNALMRVVSDRPGKWLLNHPISLSPETLALIERLDEKAGFFDMTLKAFATINSGVKAQLMLTKLPDQSALKPIIAQRALFQYAREKDLATAGKVLKRYIEPYIKAQNDPKALAQHYLTVARLLYQAGALDASVEFYDKIPNGAPQYLQAKSEVLWPLLRLGNMARLRGELKSVGNDLYEDKFLPDVYLVQSISNLKLCRYEDVQRNFLSFISTNKKWAKRISAKLKEENPNTDNKDWTTTLLSRKISYLKSEKARLKELENKSIKAALPAVGIQPHWQRALKGITFALDREVKRLSFENRRYWKNQKALLVSTIRKMRFVKVEAMTQIRKYAAMAKTHSQARKKTVRDSVKLAQAANLKDKMIFPFDGVVWPDELFNLYSTAETECLKGYKK